MKKAPKWIIWLIGGILVASPLFGQEEESEIQPEKETEGVALQREPWTGRFDLGYTWQSGRTDKNELSVRGQADRAQGPHEFRGVADFLYGTAEGEKNTHRYGAEFRWRRSLSERLFTQTITMYESDRIRELNHRVEQNVGIGYRFIKTDRMEASVVPGATIQYTDQSGVNDRWDYLASLYQDLVWKMTDAYRFEEDVNFLIDPADTDNYMVRLSAGIVGTVTQSINLSIRYRLLYENDTPLDEKTDHRLITSVGYAF